MMIFDSQLIPKGKFVPEYRGWRKSFMDFIV